METITEEQQGTGPVERLLIFENNKEIDKITSEIQQRVSLLNKLIQSGLSNNEIKEITVSPGSIDRWIFNRNLEVNKELKKLHLAGIEVKAQLPPNLADLKHSLLAWCNYTMPSRTGNKYQYLTFTDRWIIEEDKLEAWFQMCGYKLFIQGEKLKEFSTLEVIRDYLIAKRAEPGQVSPSTFLSQRFTSDTTQAVIGYNGKYMIKWSYFANGGN